MTEEIANIIGDLSPLYRFLGALDARNVLYELGRHREGTVMVKVVVPGERWEVEFFEDGRAEVEVFRSHGGMEGEEALERLLRSEDAVE